MMMVVMKIAPSQKTNQPTTAVSPDILVGI